MARLGRPELLDGFAIDLVGVGRPGLEAIALTFPVVLSRTRNTVAVVAQPDSFGFLQFLQGGLDLGEAGVGVHRFMKAGGQILRRAVDVFDELEEADGLRHLSGPGMIHLTLYVADFPPEFAGDVAGNEIVDLVDADQASCLAVGQSGSG